MAAQINPVTIHLLNIYIAMALYPLLGYSRRRCIIHARIDVIRKTFFLNLLLPGAQILQLLVIILQIYIYGIKKLNQVNQLIESSSCIFSFIHNNVMVEICQSVQRLEMLVFFSFYIVLFSDIENKFKACIIYMYVWYTCTDLKCFSHLIVFFISL